MHFRDNYLSALVSRELVVHYNSIFHFQPPAKLLFSAQRARDALVPPPADHCPFLDGANIVAVAWFHGPYPINGASRPIFRSTAGQYGGYGAFSFCLIESHDLETARSGPIRLCSIQNGGFCRRFSSPSESGPPSKRDWIIGLDRAGTRARACATQLINNQPGSRKVEVGQSIHFHFCPH